MLLIVALLASDVKTTVSEFFFVLLLTNGSFVVPATNSTGSLLSKVELVVSKVAKSFVAVPAGTMSGTFEE